MVRFDFVVRRATAVNVRLTTLRGGPAGGTLTDLYLNQETDEAPQFVSAQLTGSTSYEFRLLNTSATAQWCPVPNAMAVNVVAEPLDADSDNILDSWESTHAQSGDLDEDGNLDPAADLDGDGMTALQEFLAGTDPNDISSALRITNFTVTSAGIVTLEWNSAQDGTAPARQYRVMYTDGPLSNSSVWTELQGGIDPAGSTTTIQDDVSDDVDLRQRSYRIEIDGAPQARSTNLKALQIHAMADNREHYISFPVVPVSLTLDSLFGTSLPSGGSEATATVVDVWDQQTQTMATRYWYSDTPAWIRSSDGGNGGSDTLDLHKGIKLILRSGVGTQKLYVAGAVNTSSTTLQQTVKNNGITFSAPPVLEDVPFNASGGGDGTGLIASGFTGNTVSPNSDWVYVQDPGTGQFSVLLWYHTGTGTWRTADGSLATEKLEPGRPVLVRRQNRAGDFTWSLNPEFSL